MDEYGVEWSFNTRPVIAPSRERRENRQSALDQKGIVQKQGT